MSVEMRMIDDALAYLVAELNLAQAEAIRLMSERDAWRARHAALGRASLSLCDELDAGDYPTTVRIDELVARIRAESGPRMVEGPP